MYPIHHNGANFPHHTAVLHVLVPDPVILLYAESDVEETAAQTEYLSNWEAHE